MAKKPPVPKDQTSNGDLLSVGLEPKTNKPKPVAASKDYISIVYSDYTNYKTSAALKQFGYLLHGVEEMPRKKIDQTFDEGRLVGRKNKAVGFIRECQEIGGSYKFVLIMDDGSVHYRMHNPCWGELRPYTKDEYRPPDLYWPFPDGKPVAVGFPISAASVKQFDWDWVLFNPLSPWKEIGDKCEIITTSYGKEMAGFLIKDTRINADKLANMMLAYKSYAFPERGMLQGVTDDKEKLAIFIESLFLSHDQYYPHGSGWIEDTFCLKRLLKGTPNSNIETFYERGAYRRPVIHEIWRGTGKKGDMTQSCKAMFPKTLGEGTPYGAQLTAQQLTDLRAEIIEVIGEIHE